MGMPFTPDPNDGAVQILREIYGNIIDTLVASQPTTDATMSMLGNAFGYFNSGLLFFGSIILMFVTTFGIINSANDGEVLGNKWNTFYTPFRTLTASAMLIPTSSGFSGIQIFILMVAIWSSSFGSTIWKGVVQYNLTENIADTVVRSVMENDKFSKMAIDAMRIQSCATAVNMALASTLGDSAGQPLQPQQQSYKKSSGDRDIETTEIFYASPTWTGSKSICGSISFSTTTLKPDVDKTTNPFSATFKDTTKLEEEIYAAVSVVRRQYLLGLFGIGMMSPTAVTVQQLVDAFATPGSQGVDSTTLRLSLAQRQKEYAEAIRKAVTSYLQSKNTSLVNTLSSGGWIYAGAWQRELARIKDSVRTASNVDYQYDVNRNTLDAFLSGPILLAANAVTQVFDGLMAPLLEKAVYGINNQSGDTSTPTVPTLKSDFSYSDFVSGGVSVQQHIKTYFNHSLTQNTVAWIVSYLGKDGADPLMQIKDIGDWFIVGAETYYAGKAALKIVLASMKAGAQAASSGEISGKLGAPAVAGLEAAMQALAEFVNMVSLPMSTLMYLGYFMSIWIPMIPAFIFMLGVAGWVIAVAEAVIAGSLWAIMHLTPARDDSFIGGQAQGYLLLMSVFFRPALMILGLVVSMAGTIPLVKYSNSFFILSFRLVQTDSVTGLFSMAGFLMAYCFVIFNMLMLLFGLPQTLPDRVLRWVGGGIGDLGEQSSMNKIEGGASTQARMAATGMAHKAAASRTNQIAAQDRQLQTEQNQLLRDLAQGSKGDEPAGMGGQGVAPNIKD